MKKFYLEPEVEVVETDFEGFLCASPGVDEDGEVTPGVPDPSSDDWGSDY